MKNQSPKLFNPVPLAVLVLVTLLLFSPSSPLLVSDTFQNFLAQLRILGTNNQPSNNVFVDLDDGNVGIGTDDPITKLDVNGAVTATKFIMSDGEELGGGDDDWTIKEDGKGDNIYHATGNVGIGTDLSGATENFNLGVVGSLGIYGKDDAGKPFPGRAVVISKSGNSGQIFTPNMDLNLIGGGPQSTRGHIVLANHGTISLNARSIKAEAGKYPPADIILDARDNGGGIILKGGDVTIGSETNKKNLNVYGKIIADGEELGGGLWTENTDTNEKITYLTKTGHKLGIGTKTPTTRLTVDGHITLDGVSESRNIQMASGANNLNIRNANADKDINLDIHPDEGRLLIRTHDGADPKGTLLVIKADGKVGIGTDDPQHSLDVVGDINISGKYLVDGKEMGTGGTFGNGDVTDNKLITPQDILWVINYMNGSQTLTKEEFSRADVNGDGLVNCVDYKIINNVYNDRLPSTGPPLSKSEITLVIPTAEDQCFGLWIDNGDEDIVLARAGKKVGIGTNPVSKLTVNGSITLTGGSRNLQLGIGEKKNLNIRNPNKRGALNLDIHPDRGRLLIRTHDGTTAKPLVKINSNGDMDITGLYKKNGVNVPATGTYKGNNRRASQGGKTIEVGFRPRMVQVFWDPGIFSWDVVRDDVQIHCLKTDSMPSTVGWCTWAGNGHTCRSTFELTDTGFKVSRGRDHKTGCHGLIGHPNRMSGKYGAEKNAQWYYVAWP